MVFHYYYYYYYVLLLPIFVLLISDLGYLFPKSACLNPFLFHSLQVPNASAPSLHIIFSHR